MANRKYQKEIEDYTNQYLNNSFSYDPLTDPLYQAYKDQYANQGKTAMQDTLAQVSSRTGGLASTYATRVAQDTYNDYANKVSDKIPELYQLALSKYNQDQSALGDRISLLQNQQNTEYNRDLAEENTIYERALDKANNLAKYGDFSGYEGLGYSTDQINAMLKKYNADNTETEDKVAKLLEIAKDTGDPNDLANYYIAKGYTQEQVDSAMNNNGYEKGEAGLSENEFNKYGDKTKYKDYQDYLNRSNSYRAKQTEETVPEGTLTESNLKNAKEILVTDKKGTVSQESYNQALDYLSLFASSFSEIETAAKAIGIPQSAIDNYRNS